MASRQQLDISKLNEVLQMLRHCKFQDNKWFQLGLNLRLAHATLTAIETEHRGNVDRCLLECLSKWLTKADEVIGPLTWQTLAGALFEINQNAVADEIQKIVNDPARQLLQHYSSRLSLPEESVQLLFTEEVISTETLAEVKSRHGLLVGGPLRALHTTVAEDHNKFRLLATVLLRFDETQSLAQEILDDYDRTFPSEVHASTESSPTPTADTSTGTAAAGDHTASTDTAQTGVVVVNLNRQDQVKFDCMRTKLGTLLHNVAPLIKEKIPSVEDLKVFIKRCRPELKPQLAASETFDEVMEIIEEKCSVINISLLEGVVDQYAIEDASDLISAYNEALEQFCNEESSLRICNNKKLKTFSASHLTCETIQFTLDWEIDERTLNDINDLLSKAFRDMANRVEVVVIKEHNSITIICYAPHYLMESLLRIARENLDLLKKMGLMSLTIGYHTVYDQQARDKEMLQLDEKNRLLTDKIALFNTEKDDILRQTVQEKESEIEHLKQTLSEKEEEIQKLKEKASTVEPVITDLTEKLQTQKTLARQKTREIEGLKAALSEKEHPKEEKDNEFEATQDGDSEIKFPSNFNQLLQSAGALSEATNKVSIPDSGYKTTVISCQSLKGIISNLKFKIKVRQALVLFTGLPKSGKQEAFKNFISQRVQSNSLLPLQMENRPLPPNDISHYDLVAAADSKSSQSFQLTKATKESSCIFGILSAFQQQMSSESVLPLLDSKDDAKYMYFENPKLNDHFHHIYRYLQSGLRNEGTNFAHDIPDEYALVNMWDVPTNNIIHHILLQLQGHLTKNYLCQFLNLNRDLENLQNPPETETGGDSTIIMKWRPRLHYLLRSCRLSDSQVEQRRNVVTIFAEHDGTDSFRDLNSKVEQLNEIIEPAAEHTGVSKLLNDRIETVNIPNDLQPLSQNIKKVVSKTQVEEIPIAWLFLRSFLHYSEKKYYTCISKKTLETLAEECGMDRQSLTDFCKFYMSFGSIFDLSVIDPRSQYVIVKPIHFLRSLRNFLRPASSDKHHRFPTIKLGIVPEKAGRMVFDEDWPACKDALVCLKLATEVEIDRLELPVGHNIDPDSKCYYIPLSHTGQLLTDPDPHSIHLITSINTPDVFKEVTLVEKMLKKLPQSKLVPCSSSNQIIIKDYSTSTTVTYVSYGPAVKIHVDEPNDAVCEAIVQVYNEVAGKSPVTVKYKFVKMCIKGRDIPNARYLPSAPYHILPTDEGNGLCEECEKEQDSQLLKVWNQALRKYPIQKRSKPSGQLKPEEKTSIANKIAKLNIDVIAETFGFPNYREEQPDLKDMTESHLVKELITQWESNISSTKGAQEPRCAFARKIIELGDNLFKKCKMPGDWNREDFVKLANRVDLYYIP